MKIMILISFIIIISGYLFSQNIWEPTNGPVGEHIRAITVNTDNHIFAGSWISSGQVFRSTNNGDTWIQVTNWIPQNNVWALVVNQTQDIFVGTNGGAGIYRSTDNGDTWHPMNNGLTNNFVNGLAINDNGDIFAATDYGMFRSTDDGNIWTEINNGLPISNNIVYCVNVDKNGIVFIGTFGNGIYRSTDNGDHWEPKNNGLTHYFIYSLAINENNVVFAGPDDGQAIYRSTDSGETWQSFSNGLPAWNVSYVLVINSEGTIFAGGNTSGVYKSNDNGQTWDEFNSGLSNPFVLSLAINETDHLFAGTAGEGVFRTRQPTTPIYPITDFTATGFILEQNYPNPFNSVTRIRYALPKRSKVVLKIFNLTGEEVKTLLNEIQTPGWKNVGWNGTDSYGREVSSGVYIYRIAVDNLKKSQKMLLLK